MYVIAIGLALAGGGCLVAEKAQAAAAGHPLFELTVIGYLLAIGGGLLLTACLGASAEGWLKGRWRRASRADDGEWGQGPPQILDHH
jgi:hypothetical protein